jgi:2-succinyl-5-enolpyruvyl-6-hydroxy-3-cyclohexene-1-carboxylate synthase
MFDFLPVAREGDDYEEHVATPHGLEFAHAATLYGCGLVRPTDPATFRDAVDGALRSGTTTLVEVLTDRAENVELHRRVWEAVRSAV